MIIILSTLLGFTAGLTRSLASMTWVAVAIGLCFVMAAATSSGSIYDLMAAVGGYNLGLMGWVVGMFGWLKIRSLFGRSQATSS